MFLKYEKFVLHKPFNLFTHINWSTPKTGGLARSTEHFPQLSGNVNNMKK